MTDVDSGLSKIVLGELRELNSDEEPNFVGRFLTLFLSGVQNRLSTIEKAIQEADATGLAREAHAFKSSCFSVGAKRLGNLCLQLEQLGKAGNLEASRGVYQVLAQEAELVSQQAEALPEVIEFRQIGSS